MIACYRIFLYLFVFISLLLNSYTADAENNAVVQDDFEFNSSNLSKVEEPAPYVGPKIVVNIAARQLFLYDKDNLLVKSYPVAVGSNAYKTPAGTREMTQIVWNPWWNPPKSPWAANDVDTPPGPNNPLGPVKMKLGSAILIHGTNKPKSIGTAASHGCMRMYSQDALEVATWLQMQVTDQNTPEVFEKYGANRRRSFYVELAQPVPVDIVYDLVDVQDDKLLVYSDIYYRGKNKMDDIKAELESFGYNPEKFDWDFLKNQIKLAKNSDVILNIPDLLIKNRLQEIEPVENGSKSVAAK